MTLLLDVAIAATLLYAVAWVATTSLTRASADVRRTIWRTAFTGVAALPLLLAFDPPQAAVNIVAVAAVPDALTGVTRAVARVPWLLMVWAAGVVLVTGRLAMGLARVRQWSRTAERGDDADFSMAIAVPMTWGVVWPQILLPAAARAWSRDARDLVIRHEAAHVASHDWGWQIMARLVTAALWFHPLAWVADRQLRGEAERAADDAVLATGADPAGYAEELLNVARAISAASATAAVAMIEPSSLEHRVRHVLDASAARRPTGWKARATVVAIAAGISVSVAAMQQPPTYRVGDEGVTAPKVIKEVRPSYSQDAMDSKIEGNVILEGVITEEGLPTDVRVVKPLAPSLDRAAIDAALQWRFAPARKDGEPVRVHVTLEFAFNLK